MNSILDGGRDDEQELRGNAGQPESYAYAGGRTPRGTATGTDHEITLGTMTVLAIFFALAVVCAGFFGFGYSVGSRRAQVQNTEPSLTAQGPLASGNLPGCKPAPGSPLLAATVKSAAGPVSDASAPPSAAPAPSPVTHPVASVAAVREPAEHAAPRADAVDGGGATAAAASGAVMVQVAALSHQTDAELVANTLKSRGYAVTIRSSLQDSLLHVQVGPFASRKDAEAMRQRLLNDGFNAILK